MGFCVIAWPSPVVPCATFDSVCATFDVNLATGAFPIVVEISEGSKRAN